MTVLLFIGGSAFASVVSRLPESGPRALQARLSVIGLDDQDVFEQRPGEGVVVHEAESTLNLEAGGNSAMGNVGTSVLVSRFDGLASLGLASALYEGTSKSTGSPLSIRTVMAPSTTSSVRLASSGPASTSRWMVGTTASLALTSTYFLAGWMNDPLPATSARLHSQTGLSQFLVEKDEHEVVGEAGFRPRPRALRARGGARGRQSLFCTWFSWLDRWRSR